VKIIRIIRKKFIESNGVPGEPVGPLASHSISEPATQLTLNTFHTAGTSSLGSLGLPRLKELIDFRNTKTPIMSIFLKEVVSTYASTVEEANVRKTDQRKAVNKISAQIENSYFKDYVKKYQILFDPENQYEDDREWYDMAKQLNVYSHLDPKNLRSPFVLRYELSLRKLIEKEEILSVQ